MKARSWQWLGGKAVKVEVLTTSKLGISLIAVVLLPFLQTENVHPHSDSNSGNIVVITGKDDVISDGNSTIIVSNGNALLGRITGVPRLLELTNF
jgi:hypothetical protein